MISWLMSKYYDRMLQDAEEKCLHDWRKTLLSDLSGDVVELGSGTGANLAFYPKAIKKLVLTEPCQHMRQQLTSKLESYSHLPATIKDCSAESLPCIDNSFDYVVSTLILCSVKNPAKALSEIYRILKPSGKLLFIEHVAANDRPERFKWQKRIEPFWKLLQCGCHLTRDTETSILQAGFKLEKINRQSIRGVPPIARPGIWGVAVK